MENELQREQIIRVRLKKPKNIKFWILTLCLIFLVVGFLTRGFGFLKSNPTSSTNTDTDDFMSIPLSDITDNAKWYEYDFGNNRIKLFVVKANDGTIKTAFDACDVCYAEKKGYKQEGDYMICNNCGNRYPINSLGTENKISGGCWPGYLPNIIKGNNVLIKKTDLEDNQWRFL